MAKQLLFNEEARAKIQSGVNQVADAVRVTLGAKGRNVMFSNRNFGLPPTVTNDGVTIARQIELKDEFENMGARLIIDVAQKTNETSGDGTTTATILAQAIINEGLKNIAAGANPMELKKGIERAVEKVVANLKEIAKPIVGKEDIEKVATVSANDPEIGKIIAEVFGFIGKDGIISVEEAGTPGLSYEIVEGMNFSKGLLSGYLVTDTQTMKSVIENPVILLTDSKIASSQEIMTILQTIMQEGKKDIVVIASDMGAEAMQLVVANKIKGNINIAVIQTPGFGDDKKEVLEDIAVMTGATLISEEAGMKLGNFTMDMLGSAKRVEANRETTTIIDGKGNAAEIDERIAQVKSLLKSEKDGNKRLLLTDRLSKLTGGIGVIRVGALSETEMKERKYRIEDAVEATKAAIDEGIVAGGGVALLNAKDGIPELAYLFEKADGELGIDIVARACDYPIKQIAENAGVTGEVVANVVMAAENPNYGWNCKTGQYGDMFEMGIIDPVKVTRCAIENAASIAVMILTTEVLIVDEVQNVE